MFSRRMSDICFSACRTSFPHRCADDVLSLAAICNREDVMLRIEGPNIVWSERVPHKYFQLVASSPAHGEVVAGLCVTNVVPSVAAQRWLGWMQQIHPSLAQAETVIHIHTKPEL
eukprot:m.87249 g.87249  ORF g.87249 m.87249 type:complete len:115 (-) comp8457_c0_seq1:36-380(-)